MWRPLKSSRGAKRRGDPQQASRGKAKSHISGLDEATASVPDGICWQVPLQSRELFAPCVK